MKSKALLAVEVVLTLVVFAIVALVAFMPVTHVLATAPTSLTPQTPLGPYPGTVTAGQLALTFATADASNGNSFSMTGHEVLVVWNPDSASHTITLTSIADLRGRTSDITSYSVPATSFATFNYRSGSEGWMQSDGTVHLSSNSALVQFAVLRIP